MILKKLKYALFATLILFALPTDTYSQFFGKYPTNVRYIAGGFNNKRPYFKHLDAALNDVKALATTDNIYVFWLLSDSLQVADWDSVYNNGLSMKDSIDNHYVAEGKIKWGGFGTGGTGGGSTTALTAPDGYTTHYDLWKWTQSNLTSFYTRLSENQDSIDLKLWELIVYTDSVYLYIENDTLKLRSASVTSLLSHDRPDTTLTAYLAENQTLSGDNILSGDINVTGALRLPDGNNNTGVSRSIWSASNKPYWSGSGAAGDSSLILSVNTDDGGLNNDSLVTWWNLNPIVRDSIQAQTWINLDQEVQDSIRMQWGGMAFADSAEVITCAVNVWSVITNPDDSLWGDLFDKGDIVFDGDSIQCETAGYYKIDYSLSYSGSNTDTWYTAIFLDNVKQSYGQTERGMSGSDQGVVAGSLILYADANEWISLRVMNDVNSNDLTALAGNITIIRIY